MSIDTTIDQQSFDRLVQRLVRLSEADKADSFAAVSLDFFAQRTMQDAQRRTPVETGDLRASAYATKPTREFGKISVEVGFGGVASPYTNYQHWTNLNHPNGGQMHFLKDAIEGNKALFPQILSEVSWSVLFEGQKVPTVKKLVARNPYERRKTKTARKTRKGGRQFFAGVRKQRRIQKRAKVKEARKREIEERKTARKTARSAARGKKHEDLMRPE